MLTYKQTTRLQQKRDRLNAESAKERESRLQQMSAPQRNRLATELTKEREARLRQMNIHQHEQLEEERIHQTGEREREPSSQLVNQSSCSSPSEDENISCSFCYSDFYSTYHILVIHYTVIMRCVHVIIMVKLIWLHHMLHFASTQVLPSFHQYCMLHFHSSPVLFPLFHQQHHTH